MGRYIPNPNDVPIPVAHSANAPNSIPKNSALKSPFPLSSTIVNDANAFACGARRSIFPFASKSERKIATAAPNTAPGTTPIILPLEM